MSLLDYRIGLAGGNMHMLEARQTTTTTCNLAAGGLYLFPNSSSTVDASQPVTFKWNTACSGMSSTVNLYLYTSGSTGLIQAWTGLTFSEGSYTTTLLPKWWNSTTTASLQVNIVNSTGMAWASVPGPVWKVTYPESAMFTTVTDSGGAVKTSTAAVAAATNSGDAIIQNVTNTKEGGIAKGAIAAAVIVPLIAIAALVAVAVRFWRQREAEKRRRWSQALSQHSALEWEKGARSGEKTQSILGRPSLSTYMRGGGSDAGRASMATSSIYAVENNLAGAGAAGLALGRPSNLRSVSADNVNASTTSLRSSVIMPNGEVRQSRISFAESARPDRRSRMSFGGDLRPPNPAVFKNPAGSRSAQELVTPRGKLSSSPFIEDDDEDGLNVSPTQRDGPSGIPRVVAGVRTGARRSVLSLVGGGDKRRESTASALSAQDFRSAVEAGGSVDELRDLETMMLARRSVMSQYSANRSSSFVEAGSPGLTHSPQLPGHHSGPSTPVIDTDQMEDLSVSDSSQSMNAGSYFKPLPSAASASTVAYGPDQMLAVYAARAANAKSPPGSAGSAIAPAPFGAGSMGKKGGMKILTGFGRKDSDVGAAGYADVQRENAMSPTAAPSPSLRVPPVVMTRQRSGTVGRGGQPSPSGGDDVGQAQ